MEEIDILDFFRYYLSKAFITIIAIFLLVVGGNIYCSNIRVPLYKSDTTVVLVSETEDKYTQSDLTFNKNLVATYSNIVKSRTVLGEVINNLELDYTIDQLYNMITVSSVDNTEIMKITVSNKDSVLAMRIANAIVPVFSSEIDRIYGIDNVSVIDRALIAPDPYNVNVLKENIIFVLAGLLLGSAVIFVIYYFDSSVKSAEMIEDKFGLPVLGMVPKLERRG